MISTLIVKVIDDRELTEGVERKVCLQDLFIFSVSFCMIVVVYRRNVL